MAWRNAQRIHSTEQLCGCAPPSRSCWGWLAYWWVLHNFESIFWASYGLLNNISIGDRGYPLKPEQHYNRVHARSRSVVERAIGLLKGRWLCLSSVGGALQYKPEKVCHIILACCVLHNLAIRHGVPLQEPHRADEPMPSAEHFPLPNAAAIQTERGSYRDFR